MTLPVASFARDVTLPAVAAEVGGGTGGAYASDDAELLARYAQDARHNDELHRLRATVGPRAH